MKTSELVFFICFGAVVTYMVTMALRDWLRKRRIVASLAARVQRNDEQFGQNYFPEPKRAEVAARVRRILAKNLKMSLDGLASSDRLNEDLNAELPLNPHLFWDLETEFGIKSGLENMEYFEKTLRRLVTFQDLVAYVESKIAEPPAETPRQEESEKPSRAYEIAIRSVPYLCVGGFLIGVGGAILQMKWATKPGILLFLTGIVVWVFATGGEVFRNMIQDSLGKSFKEIATRPWMLILQTCVGLAFLFMGGALTWGMLKIAFK